MKRLCALPLLTFLALTATAHAASHDYDCVANPDVPINITQRFDNPAYDYNASLQQIQAMSSDTRHSIREGLTLGLTRYNPFIAFHTPVRTVKFPNGFACAHVDHVDVEIGYKDVTVYVAHEIPQHTCGFDQIMAHEQKHIAVNRQILQEYTPIIQQQLKDYLRTNGSFQQEHLDYGMQMLNQRLNTILNDLATEMNNENHRRQALIDTQEEYHRVTVSCNGQLAQITRRFLTSH